MSAVGADGASRTLASQILVDQLTLSQPVGQIMPTPLLLAPQIFKPSYGPAVSKCDSTSAFKENNAVKFNLEKHSYVTIICHNDDFSLT